MEKRIADLETDLVDLEEVVTILGNFVNNLRLSIKHLREEFEENKKVNPLSGNPVNPDVNSLSGSSGGPKPHGKSICDEDYVEIPSHKKVITVNPSKQPSKDHVVAAVKRINIGGVEVVNLSPKEKEYRSFSEYIYSRTEYSENCFRSTGKSVYPRVVCIKGSDPEFVKRLADYGYLDLIYPDVSLGELFNFDPALVSKVSQYGQKKSVCLKFYTISPEYDDEVEYEAIHLISLNIVTNSFNLEVGQSRLKEPIFSRDWASYRRAAGVTVIKSIASNLYERGYKVLLQQDNFILCTPGTGVGRSGVLASFISDIDGHQIPCRPSTRRIACEKMEHLACLT